MKLKRHAKILELISESNINTQEELQDRLNQEGFSVTQQPFPAISRNFA